MTEIWKDIKGYEGLYQVSDQGRVKSLTREIEYGERRRTIREKILKPSMDNGYFKVCLYKNGAHKNFLISTVVTQHFLRPPRRTYVINHVDGDRANNRVDNLECLPPNESPNIMAWQKLYMRAGDVLNMRKLVETGMPRRDVAKFFGVSQSTVSYIISGKTWKPYAMKIRLQEIR